MNEPPRRKGSLVERAAKYYHFGKAEPSANARPSQGSAGTYPLEQSRISRACAPELPRAPEAYVPEPPRAPETYAPEQPRAPETYAPEPPRAPETYVPEPPRALGPLPLSDHPPAGRRSATGEAPSAARRSFDMEQPTTEEYPSDIAPPRARARRTIQIDRRTLAREGLLVPGAPVNRMTEEFRLVKRQLLLTARALESKEAKKGNRDRDIHRERMILVCSSRPNDGKTFCAINLALSMAAERDVEIVLVDADLAKPDVCARLGIGKIGPGLMDALAGAVPNVEDCIVRTDIPNLSVLPAGARSVSDAELLTSERAIQLLSGLALANQRRIVIFDSPPALEASLATVLASYVGQVMLVVRADVTSDQDLREAVSLLDGCEHIQLVLNGVSFRPWGRRLGNYYYGES